MSSEEKGLEANRKRFIDNLEKQGRSTSTILAYRSDIRQLIEFLSQKGVTQTTSVQNDHLEEFRNSLLEDYTPKSISRKLNSIKTFFRYLNENTIIKANPAEEISLPKLEPKPPKILNQTEYRALRDAARKDNRMSAIIELLLQTGIRIGELGRLELDDITEKELKIRAYESHPARKVPLNQAVKRAIDRYLEERPKTRSRRVFVTRSGRPFLVRNIRTAINRFFRLAGIKRAKVNSLRHTFIAHQLANGVPVTLVQKIVGHKRVATTEKYMDLVDSKGEEKIKLEEL